MILSYDCNVYTSTSAYDHEFTTSMRPHDLDQTTTTKMPWRLYAHGNGEHIVRVMSPEIDTR